MSSPSTPKILVSPAPSSRIPCKENHGMFVRQTQLTILTETGSRIDLVNSSASTTPQQITSPDDAPRSTPKSRLTSSRTSLSGKSRESRSREDMSSSTSSLASSADMSTKKASSFVEKTPTTASKVKTGIPRSTPRRTSKTSVPTTTKQDSKDEGEKVLEEATPEPEGSEASNISKVFNVCFRLLLYVFIA
uniref:Dynactin subunit 1 n=1 Tax=Lygus hesperus TaxID=30085 RepID=A0A0A9YC54_LYGHE